MDTNKILDQYYRMNGTAYQLAPQIAQMFGESTSDVLKVLVEEDRQNKAASARMNPEGQKRHGHTCHYCGQPAKSIGSFGEHVCDDCS